MPVHPHDRHLTAMPTLSGTLQWRVLPTGDKNGAAELQRLMEWILQHRHLDDDDNGNSKFAYEALHNISIYIDDLIPGSEDIHTHYHDLRRLLDRLREWQIVCGGQAKDKDKIIVSQVEFCGQILSRGTTRPSPGDFMVIEQCPDLKL